MEITDAKKLFSQLKNYADKFVSAWQDLQKFINQTRGVFNGDRSSVGKMIDHKTMLSGYATLASRIFASGLNSGMTNKSSRWFKLSLDNKQLLDIPGVRDWLDAVQELMYSIINQSNLYDCFYTAYEELGDFGTGCFMVLEDFDDIIRGKSFTIGEYCLGTNEKGRVNKFSREFDMTVDQVIREFGYESASTAVQAMFNNKQTENMVKICHLIVENTGRDVTKQDVEGMPYVSLYWEKGNDAKYLAKRGFNRFPIVAPRWDVVTTDMVYGYGPGWYSLGMIKELQVTRQDKLFLQAKLHNPPIQQDSSVEGHFNGVPGGVTKSSGAVPNIGVRPAYQVPDALNSFVELISEEKEEIDRFFFVNLFLMLMNIDKTNMTATEVAERQQEKIMMMGPALHRLDEEMLTPVLDIVYEIMIDFGMIPEPPEEIADQQIKVEYTSILAQAQQASGITKIQRTVAFAGEIAGIDPSVLDVVDFDEAVKQVAEMEGAAAKVIREDDEIQARREARKQQEEMAQNIEAANSAADTAKKLSEAQTDEPSALTGIMNSAQ